MRLIKQHDECTGVVGLATVKCAVVSTGTELWTESQSIKFTDVERQQVGWTLTAV